MFIKHDGCKLETLDNGVQRRIKGWIDDLMVVELYWKKGMCGAVHAHPNRQCGYIISGTYEASVNGEKQVLHAGDCFYVEANVKHGLLALEDGVTLDIFTPYRMDFVKA